VSIFLWSSEDWEDKQVRIGMVAVTAGAGVAGAPDPATSSTPGVELELGGEGCVNALGGRVCLLEHIEKAINDGVLELFARVQGCHLSRGWM
jgi:hypothetical protein